MKHINKFNTHEEYYENVLSGGGEYPKPSIGLVTEDETVRYSPTVSSTLEFNATAENSLCSSCLGPVKYLYVDGEKVVDNEGKIGTYVFTTSGADIDPSGQLLAETYPFLCISYILQSDTPILDEDELFSLGFYYGTPVPGSMGTIGDGISFNAIKRIDEYTINVTRLVETLNYSYGDMVPYPLTFLIRNSSYEYRTVENIVNGPLLVPASHTVNMNKDNVLVHQNDIEVETILEVNGIDSIEVKYLNGKTISENDIILFTLEVLDEKMSEFVPLTEFIGAGYIYDTTPGGDVLRFTPAFINQLKNSGTEAKLGVAIIQGAENEEDLAEVKDYVIDIEIVYTNGYNTDYTNKYIFQTLGKHSVKYELFDTAILHPSWRDSCITKIYGRELEGTFSGLGSFLGSTLNELYTTKHFKWSITEPTRDVVHQLKHLKIEKDHSVYDSRENCNALIKTSTNKLIYASSGVHKIPDSVVDIDDYAFENTTMSSVILPKNLTAFPRFYGCPNLEKVTYYDKITKFNTFWLCPKIKTFVIPPGVTSLSYAFYNCSSLESISIGPNVTGVTSGDFAKECQSLKKIMVDPENPYIDTRDNCNSIIKTSTNQLLVGCAGSTIPNTVTSINNLAFENRKNLKTIHIPGSVQTIGNRAFAQCAGLTDLVIESGVQSIQYSAFTNCTSLKEVILPDSVTSLGDSCFQSTGVKKVHIGNGITEIPSSCFNSCQNLEELIMPNSLTAIGKYAFEYCRKLTGITIPSGVTNLTSRSFSDCDALQEINIGSGIASISYDTFMNAPSLSSITISPANKLYTDGGNNVIMYKSNGYIIKGSNTTVLNDNIKGILKHAFQRCKNLSEVVIPDSVAHIGEYAFSNCSGLTSLYIGKSRTSIPNSCFSYCSSLERIEIPDNIIDIQESAFYNCVSLNEIIIGENVNTVGRYAFLLDTGNTLNRKVICKPITPPSFNNDAFYNNNFTIYYPFDADYSTCQTQHPEWHFMPDYENVECLSLTITADDVKGVDTTTNIHYELTIKGYSNITNENVTTTLKRTVVSDEFPQNTSATDTVERTITFEYGGMSATTTITQGVWEPYYTVTLNDEWMPSPTIGNPNANLYDGVYESFSNVGVYNSRAAMYIDINGYEEFSIYVRSYAYRTSCVIVSELDKEINKDGVSTSDTTLVKGYTTTQNSNTAINGYQKLTWTGIDKGKHRITVLYRRTSSVISGTDRGYLLITK